MGLETATFIQSLVSTNPTSSDDRSQGDDHLRLLKAVLRATFPNADKASYFPTFSAVLSVDTTVVAADMGKTFLCDTPIGGMTLTLPTLTADDKGWQCHFLKTNTAVYPLFIAPASGTLTSGEVSGLAKARRAIPGYRTTALWTGTAWFLTRALGVPVGTVLEFGGESLPVGYEWPNGQTLTSASTAYPEFYAANGNSGVVKDRRGRVSIGKDDMGGSAASRVTTGVSGIDGATLGANGGAQKVTLLNTDIPARTVTGSLSAQAVDVLRGGTVYNVLVGSGSPPAGYSNHSTYLGDALGTITISSATTPNSSTDVNKMPPGIVMNCILVVE